MKMSSSDVRDRTRWLPSTASRRPAVPPSRVEPVRRRMSRMRIATPMIPAKAAPMRQPTSS